MSPLLTGGVAILVLLALLAIDVPVGFALWIVGLGGMILVVSPAQGLAAMQIFPFSTSHAYLFIAIPMFVLMGNFVAEAGISDRAYRFAHELLARVPGGLAISTIVACAVFGATCGSSLACAATMGRMAIPEMEKYGYDPKLATGSAAAGGLLAILIPPSIPFVVYGSFVGLSVGKLFVAGILPGLLTTLVFAIGIFVMIKRNPSLAPSRAVVKTDSGKRLRNLADVWPVALLFVVVMGAIYTGVFTPTEAASAGAFLSFILLMAWTKNRGKALWGSLLQTCRTVAMLFTIIIGSVFFSTFLVRAGFPLAIAKLLGSWHVAPMLMLLIMLVIYIPLGMFLEGLAMMLITLPIFYPVITALGFNGIWYGILLVKMIEIGLLTPPVGMNVFTVKAVAPQVPLSDIYRGVNAFLVMEAITVVLLIAFPQITLFLPSLMSS